ncbi:hypothetical protein [Ekhidna sp.]
MQEETTKNGMSAEAFVGRYNAEVEEWIGGRGRLALGNKVK